MSQSGAGTLRRVISIIPLMVMLAGSAWAQDSGEIEIHQYEGGGIYEGTFRGGVQHGTGTYRLPNGYEYTGEWVDGEIRGQGRAVFPDGSIYEGSFAAGRPEGFGMITFADGSTYEGEWSDGEIDGMGKATYANGDVYEGMFVKGKRQGEGTIRYASGEERSGNWQDGVLTQDGGSEDAPESGSN